MVLYSDGVTEAHNVAGEEFGEERLVDGAWSAITPRRRRVVLEQIIDAVKAFARGAEQYDDVTALVVKYTGPK